MQNAENYAQMVRYNWGMFVSSQLAVYEDDVDKFRYNVSHNRRLQQIAVHRVFRKSGRFIFQLGIVNFLEQLIIQLFLGIHVFNREKQIYEEAASAHMTDKIVELPYLRTHVSNLHFD